MLKDTGKRTVFSTGAQREVLEEKGRCDLLPLDVLIYLDVFKKYREVAKHVNVAQYAETIQDRIGCIKGALYHFCEIRYKGDATEMVLELSKHYSDGAKKYAPNNWSKGIPVNSFFDSGIRHLLKLERGDDDEPHDRAFVWNMVGAIWTMMHKPELDNPEIYSRVLEEEQLDEKDCRETLRSVIPGQ